VSNRWKAELVNNDFSIWSYHGGHGEILPRDQFMPKGQVCPEFFKFSNLAKFRMMQLGNRWLFVVVKQTILKLRELSIGLVFGTSGVLG
jgi:hypothetical protein